MNKKRLWKKFFRILLSRVPVILFSGITIICFIAAWALDFRTVFLNIAALVSLFLTCGTIGQIFLLSGENIARQAMQEIKQEADDSRDSSLDHLHERLSEDGDPRTEKALKDLRELAKAIKISSAGEDSKLDTQARVDIHQKVDQLFEKCVNRLEKSLDLWKNSQEISNQKVKKRVLSLRGDIIAEIRSNILYLTNILEKIQVLNYGQRSGSDDVINIMKDLDEGIAIAKKVDEQMRKLESEKRHLE